jgi:hypothetical protein
MPLDDLTRHAAQAARDGVWIEQHAGHGGLSASLVTTGAGAGEQSLHRYSQFRPFITDAAFPFDPASRPLALGSEAARWPVSGNAQRRSCRFTAR